MRHTAGSGVREIAGTASVLELSLLPRVGREQCAAFRRRRDTARTDRPIRLAGRAGAGRHRGTLLRSDLGGGVTLYDFISGAIMIGSFVAALFFYRFWRRTLDRLFVWFAIAFLILGIERLVLVLIHANETAAPVIYIMRLIAFAVIIAAIVDKNR